MGTVWSPHNHSCAMGGKLPRTLLLSDQTMVLINLIPVYPRSCKNPCPWISMPSSSTPLLTVIHTTLHHSLKAWTPASQLLFPWRQCSREYVQTTSILQRSASPTHFSPLCLWSRTGSHHHIELFVLWNVKFLPLKNGFCYNHFIRNVFTVLTNVFLKIFFYLAVPGHSCGMQDLQSLSWCLKFGSLKGIKPGPPALGAWNLSHWTTREVPPVSFATKTQQMSFTPLYRIWLCCLCLPSWCSFPDLVPKSLNFSPTSLNVLTTDSTFSTDI